GSSWDVSVHSTPISIGSGVTDGAASLTFSGIIPRVVAGVHHVAVSSTSSTGVANIHKLWFVCDQAGTIIGVYATEAEANTAWASLQTSASSLSHTGIATTQYIRPLAIGVLLLTLGLTLVTWRRRKTP
ncbi:MAG: hypothetical protein AAB357_03895, partial [Actinomycetota bacterium]